MELSLKEFLGKYLDRKLQVKEFKVDDEGRTSFTFVDCPFAITIDPRNGGTGGTSGTGKSKAKPVSPVTPATPAPKRGKDKEYSDKELEEFMMIRKEQLDRKNDPNKKTRRIKCPKSGEMITSEQYHINKKAGMYLKV